MKKILLFVIFALNLAFAKPEDFKTATWNLQGSSAMTESKWSISIRQIVSGQNAVDILAVQEAGSLPATVRATMRQLDTSITQIAEYIWELGTVSRPEQVYIYYAQTDTAGNRVNLAIVSRQRADEVIVLPPPSVASRPIIGIRLGNDVFFNIHALANGGTDVPAIVNSVFSRFTNEPQTTWMIMGDFNRSPDISAIIELQIRVRMSIIATNQSTQRSGGNLDWAIVGNSAGSTLLNPALSAVLMLANLRTHIVSDHFPVNFRKFGD